MGILIRELLPFTQPARANSRTAAAGLANLAGLPCVPVELWNLSETVLNATQQLPVEPAFRRSERIINPCTLPARGDQPSLAEVSQVSGRSGLGDAKDSQQIAHTHLRVLEQTENSQARPIGEGPKHQIDAIRRAAVRPYGCHP